MFLFPLFAVLLHCPYPDPPVSAWFFPFSSAPRQGEGRPCGTFVAGRSQTRTPCKTGMTGESGLICGYYFPVNVNCKVHVMQMHKTSVAFLLILALSLRGNSKYHYYGIRVKPDSPLNRLQEDMQYMAMRQQPMQQKQR